MPTEALKEFFNKHPSAALGFSGGVDSSYLLYAGLACGAAVKPYFIKTAFQPAFELSDAERLCAGLGVALTVIPLAVLSEPSVAENPADRCYHCKKRIFGTLKKRAAADGFAVLLDGNNASDDTGDRPGMRACAELGVFSPLREAGLTKDEIRRLSKEAGLFTWDKPAYACLATRINTGRTITAEMLEKIEKAEDILFSLGFYDFRVRVAADGAARIQCPASQMPEVLRQREKIMEALSPGFAAVTLDLKGR